MRILFLLLLISSATARADLLVVTGSHSLLDSLTEQEVRQLFSGHLRQLHGLRLQPLDLPLGNADRDHFYRQLMGRTPEQMRAYWTRLLFAGQGQPPREVSSLGELSSLVGTSSEYIGYLPADALRHDLKVLYRLP